MSGAPSVGRTDDGTGADGRTGAGEAIHARGLTKRYGPVVAVDAVDLTVSAGQVHGLIGPNGAGKTTVLAMLFGLVEPDGGTLRLLGRDRASVERGWLEQVGGFIETPMFYPYLSGRRNLEHLARLDGPASGSRLEEALEGAGLRAAADNKVRGYSLGMRQRLGLAAALLRAPRLLILDEPANGLDPAGARDLRLSLRHLTDAGAAVLLSSHDMGAIEDLCDQVTVLRAGRAVFDGSLAQMRAAAPAAAHRLHTNDDARASVLAVRAPGVHIGPGSGAGLTVHAEQEDLDAFVIELARAGIAVRGLRLEVSPLESLFFQLTEGGDRQPRPLRRRNVPAVAGTRR